MKTKTNRVATILLLAALALASMVLTGCAPPVEKPTQGGTTGSTSVPEPTTAPPTETSAPPVEQKLTIAVSQVGESLDATSGSRTSWRQEYLIYDPLAKIDEAGNAVPMLATSWQALDDTTWEFKLREGVKFHNGEEFDAEAVKFTIEFLQNPDTNSNYARNISMIKEVQVIDKYTVHIITDGPQAVLVPNLAGVLILPPKYFADVGREAFNKAPVGTGPYKLVEYAPDDKVVLERNEDYWGDTFLLDTVEFVEMPEESTRIAALEAGEVDIIDEVSVDQAQRLQDAGFVVDATTEAFDLFMLLETPLQREEYPFLSDRQVRQALNYAVNKQEIVDTLTNGYGRPAMGTFVGPDGFGYNPDTSMYEYDPDKARQMLADAGYPDGFTFPMYYPVGRYPYGDEVVAVVAGYLAEIGVTMELKPLENSDWVAKYVAVELPTTLVGPNYDPTMDADRIIFLCYTNFPRKWVTGNPEFDALFEKQRSILIAEERLPVLQAAERKCAEMAPGIFTIFPPSIYAYNPQVQDLHLRTDGKYDLVGVSMGP